MTEKDIFEFLNNVNGHKLFMTLQREHPQTIAVICSCISPEQAAYIISSLAPERQLAVLRRIIMMRAIDLRILSIVAYTLKLQLEDTAIVELGGYYSAARIIDQLDLIERTNILDNLEQDDSDLVAGLKDAVQTVRTINKIHKGGLL